MIKKGEKSKTNQFVEFECYDNEGNFVGYFVSEEWLDEYAKAIDLADDDGKHTEASDEMFKTERPCFLDYVEDFNLQWGEYQITPFE